MDQEAYRRHDIGRTKQVIGFPVWRNEAGKSAEGRGKRKEELGFVAPDKVRRGVLLDRDDIEEMAMDD